MPKKKPITIANIKYYKLGETLKFVKRDRDSIKPKKIANPPKVDIKELYDVRLSGLSTNPFAMSTSIIIGITPQVTTKATARADISNKGILSKINI